VGGLGLVAGRPSAARAVALVERGLSWFDAEGLAQVLGVRLDRLATLLDIPPATFYRRRRARRFSRHESDRLMRFVRLWWLARDVFESDEGARAWLAATQFGLGGAVPLEYARTEAGAHEVEDLLRRIDYGVLA
jgi:putative toxin-antitoxin system antitoxin component (TIGR02293 family)